MFDNLQCVSYEKAKLMKALNWEIRALLSYEPSHDKYEGSPQDDDYRVTVVRAQWNDIWRLEAPTATDILQALPYKVVTGAGEYFLEVQKWDKEFRVAYLEMGESVLIEAEGDIHDACADIWIWLRMKKYI